MPNRHLPEELLDDIVDLLHDSGDALKSCSLVSKSWIPRARKHLFADIKFTTPEHLQSWKITFSDPSTSPACYTKALLLKYPPCVATTDGEEVGWISTFTRVAHFQVDAFDLDIDWSGFNLTPFHGFSPAMRSLRLIFYVVPSSQVFNLIHSFPLLEDLAVTSLDRWMGSNDALDDQTAVQPSISPSFTGSLELDLWTQTDFVASRLLSLSGSIRFRRLQLTLNKKSDASAIAALVETCRFTLEYLEVACELLSKLPSVLIDLSRATQLKSVVFVCEVDPHWIITTLQTITHDHRNLQRLSIIVPEALYLSNLNHADPADIMYAVGEIIYQEWLMLDKLLAQLWESHSIRPEILYDVPSSMDGERASSLVGSLLPELTRRGITRPIRRQ